jgi:hypothetical protein
MRPRSRITTLSTTKSTNEIATILQRREQIPATVFSHTHTKRKLCGKGVWGYVVIVSSLSVWVPSRWFWLFTPRGHRLGEWEPRRAAVTILHKQPRWLPGRIPSSLTGRKRGRHGRWLLAGDLDMLTACETGGERICSNNSKEITLYTGACSVCPLP